MRRPATLAVLVALTWGLPAQAQAQRTATPQDLGTATLESLLNIQITTATRTAEGLGEAPARVQVITSEQILRRGYRSVMEVLKDLSDFKVDLAGDQDYQTELAIQGIHGAKRIVLLLDGVRVSSPTNEPLPILANYPVHNARQIEIVYGPASALYGADAFSAVINVVTKTAEEASGLTASSSFGQFGLFNQTASFGATLTPNTTLMLSGQALLDGQPDLSKYYPADFRGLAGQRSGTFNTIFGPMTSDRPVPPGYDIPISAHSLHAVLRTGGLRLMLFENHARVPTTPAYTPDNGVYSPDAFNLNKLLVTSASYERPIGRVTSTSTFTYSRHELDADSGYWNVYSNMTKSFKYAFGRMAKLEEQLSWKASPKITMTTGGTFEHFHAIPQGADLNAPLRSHSAPATILGTDIPDRLVKLWYSNSGAFGHAQYALAPPITLTVGARADYNTRFGASFNPRAGAVARLARGTTLKMLYGTAYLAPSPFESYLHYGSFYTTDGGATYASSYWHLPNPDLGPQRKKTVEVELLQSLGSSFHVSASGVYSRFTDLIKDSDPDRSYSGLYLGWPVDHIDFPVNEGHAESYGGTFAIDFVRALDPERRVSARAAISVFDGLVWEEDPTESLLSVPLGLMSPLQLRLGTDIDWYRWSLAPRLSVTGSQRLEALDDASIRRRTLDGYATLDVNIRRRNVLKNVDAFVTVENATDVRYRAINARAYTNPEELIGAPQNPRRFTVGLDVRIK